MQSAYARDWPKKIDDDAMSQSLPWSVSCERFLSFKMCAKRTKTPLSLDSSSGDQSASK